MGIVILAPWAFIGFESISYSAAVFKFPAKKSLPIMLAALLTGALTYIMLTLSAAMAVPDGYADWGEYISALAGIDGVKGLPTFYAAREAMGCEIVQGYYFSAPVPPGRFAELIEKEIKERTDKGVAAYDNN